MGVEPEISAAWLKSTAHQAVRLPCRKLPAKIGDALTPQQYRDIEDLGILADKDDQVGCCCAFIAQHATC